MDSINIIEYTTIDSTNVEAMRRINTTNKSLHGTVILAENQTAGKGRLGRSFYSPKTTGVYLSIICESSRINVQVSEITPYIAVAVKRAIKNFFNLDVGIKWVNDLYFMNRKICGILAEGVISTKTQKIENVVIGIGINLLKPKEGFPKDIENKAGVLVTDSKDIDRKKLIYELVNQVFNILDCSENERKLAMKEYQDSSILTGREVTVISSLEQYQAIVKNITDQGHLIVNRIDEKNQIIKTEEIYTGEVSIKL